MISAGVENNMQTSEGPAQLIHMDHRLHLKAPQPPSSSKLFSFPSPSSQILAAKSFVLIRFCECF